MEPKHSWSLLIGSRRLAGKGRRFSRGDEKLLQEITTRHFPEGYTILGAQGGWFDPERKRFLQEESRQVLVTGEPARVRRWAIALGGALRQTEILLVRLGRAFAIKVR